MRLVQLSVIWILISASSAKSAFPPSLRYPLPISVNKIVDANLTCDERSFNATVTLQHPFKGLVFARDFSHECNSIGTLSNSVTLSIPTSGCGIRLSSRTTENGQKQMVYSVVLVAQQDRHLRQIADQEKYLECVVEDDVFLIKSQSMVEVLKNELMEQRGNQRSARMRKEETDSELDEVLAASRAWMEITPEDDSAKSSDTLKVGETAMLLVKSTLPAGIGWKVVECTAHDGLGDSSQKLLDDDGCPIDELLLPIPEMGPVQPISLMKHQEAVARFAAFKFPDRDRLHLSCYLELCRGACPKVDCHNRNETVDNRAGRILSKGAQGEILDRLKVFNSVEVLAPAIDDLRNSEKLQLGEPSPFPFSALPGDRTFCVSPDKIAITFCILGIIFLCAVIVATCALLRSRKNGNDSSFYSRSLFSSSSGGSAYGSKLLLHESPCMGQPPPTRMPYGRIL